MKKKDPPTKLKLAYGKIRVTPKKVFYDRSMILTTQTAAISIVDAKFAVVASEYETKVLAYSSKVGVANINPALKRAFVIIEGEEVSIRKNASPSMPLHVPSGAIRFWLENHSVTDDFKYIRKTTREEGFIDWLLRKREF
jgi:ferric-dicitrate binding protein FerR (iron transport regulator)